MNPEIFLYILGIKLNLKKNIRFKLKKNLRK